MATKFIQDARIQQLNGKEVRDGSYVLYWMQSSQRTEYNHALEYAIQRANDLEQRLLVCFGLMDDYPEANARHYTFMLEGLQEVETSLKERDIKFVVQRGSPDEVALRLGQDASLIVCDRGYMRNQRQWRGRVADEAPCLVTQVESDVVVPVELVSDKKEYAARTIRPKIQKHLDDFLVELRTTPLDKYSKNMSVDGLDLSDVEALVDELKLDKSVEPVSHLFKGGTSQGRAILDNFIENKFSSYDSNRNQPQTSDVSHMSKYLHFGQISPVYIALQIQEAHTSQNNIDSYLEEVIIRRELPMNFVYYMPDTYDSFKSLPDWAQETLEEHKDDEREYVYTRQELEDAQTHDDYWNAAMREMRHTGYMHNYMRMYWGKKILQWSNTPRYAYETTLYLNNKYFLDGRDPNSFANVAWVFGQHDRGWTEREVFGKVRYMSAGGLERKAKPEQYVEKVNALIEEGRAP